MFGPSLRSGRRPIIRLQITKVLAPFFSFLRTPRFNIVAFIVENSRYEHKKNWILFSARKSLRQENDCLPLSRSQNKKLGYAHPPCVFACAVVQLFRFCYSTSFCFIFPILLFRRREKKKNKRVFYCLPIRSCPLAAAFSSRPTALVQRRANNE